MRPPRGPRSIFEPGVYRGVSLTPKEGQTFIGAEGAILNGSEVLTNWTKAAAYGSLAVRLNKVTATAPRKGPPGNAGRLS